MSQEKTFQTVPTRAITRAFSIEVQGVDETSRSVPISFASETPCYEPELDAMLILDHSPGSVDFSRMEGGPVLVQHNEGDQVAVAEGCVVSADRKSRAVARFSKATRANEIFQDVKDGIRRQVSVRARLNKLVIEKAGEGLKTLRAISWTPLEMSIVGLAKDATVGVMRQDDQTDKFPTEIEVQRSHNPINPNIHLSPLMTAEEKAAADLAAQKLETARSETLTGERKRITDISASVEALLKTYPEAINTFRGLETKAIREGTSHADFNMSLLASLPGVRTVTRAELPTIGLGDKEAKRFSILRAVHALANKDWKDAGFELECSRAVEKIAGAPAHGGFYVPYEVQQIKRDQTVASAPGGGYLVATQQLAGSFIEMLRAQSMVIRLGARVLSGLRDNVTIPKQTGASTAYWLATESTQITESALTFGQLALTPKTVGAYVEISRLMMLQSNPSIDALVMDDLAKTIALAVDTAAISGTGSDGQPQGLIGTSGVGSVVGTSLALAGILEFQADLAAANSLSLGAAYVTTPLIASLLMARQRFSSTDTPLWDGGILEGNVMGFRGTASIQVPTGDLIFGDWSQIIIGEWGILEIMTNPYADFKAGIIGIRAFQTVDVGVRYAGAFSVATVVT